MPLKAPRCIECRYPRRGLPDGAPCPECSAPAPDEGWLVVVGSTTEWNPNLALIAGGAMITAALGLGVLAWFSRFAPPIPMILGLTVGGLVIGYRSLRAARAMGDGGDVLWIARDDGIEVRGAFGSSVWPWERITYALYEQGWRAARLSFGGPTSDTSNEAGLWLHAAEGDARAIHAELRRRIALARERESAAPSADARTRPIRVNPPDAPPPGPS